MYDIQDLKSKNYTGCKCTCGAAYENECTFENHISFYKCRYCGDEFGYNTKTDSLVSMGDDVLLAEILSVIESSLDSASAISDTRWEEWRISLDKCNQSSAKTRSTQRRRDEIRCCMASIACATKGFDGSKTDRRTFNRCVSTYKTARKMVNALTKQDTVSPDEIEQLNIKRFEQWEERYRTLKATFHAGRLWRRIGVIGAICIVCGAAIGVLGGYEVVYTDDPSGISVQLSTQNTSFFGKFFSELHVQAIREDEPAYAVTTQAIGQITGRFVVYDIFVPHVEDAVPVTIPIPEGMSADALTVYHIAEDGTHEEIPCTSSKADHTVSFYTDHFSLFALAEKGFQVSFRSDGETVEVKKTTWGHTVEAPTLTKPGYTFNGWTYDGRPWDVATHTVTSNVVLTAVWIPNDYRVILDPAGGTLSEQAEQTYTYGKNCTLPIPTREHYDFDGWYHNGTPIADGAWSLAEDVTLTAQWKLHPYRVTFVMNGQTVAEQTVSYGERLTEPTGIDMTGYTMMGWSHGGEVWSFADHTVSSDLELTAQVTPHTYWVTLDAAGGNVETSEKQVTYGKVPNLPTPTRRGYTFDGWYYDGRRVDNVPWRLTENVELRASWSNGTYTVHYDPNQPALALDDVTGSMSDSQLSYGKADRLDRNQFALNGWSFLGWSLSPGGGIEYADGAELTQSISDNQGSVTLYAVWSVKPVTYEKSYESGKKITDTGELGLYGKDTADAVSCTELSHFMSGEYVFTFKITIEMAEVDDGYQQIFLYNNNEIKTDKSDVTYEYAHGKGMLAEQVLETGSGVLETERTTHHVVFEVTGDVMHNPMYIRYDAKGKNDDTWKIYKVAVEVSVREA